MNFSPGPGVRSLLIIDLKDVYRDPLENVVKVLKKECGGKLAPNWRA